MSKLSPSIPYEDINEMVIRKGFKQTIKYITGRCKISIDDAMKRVNNAVTYCDEKNDGWGDELYG